jgi:hypothetical protein
LLALSITHLDDLPFSTQFPILDAAISGMVRGSPKSHLMGV